MKKTHGSFMVVGDGKFWKHNDRYLGRYFGFRLIGQAHDPEPEYTFEHGVISGLGLKFTEVEPTLNPSV